MIKIDLMLFNKRPGQSTGPGFGKSTKIHPARGRDSWPIMRGCPRKACLRLPELGRGVSLLCWVETGNGRALHVVPE